MKENIKYFILIISLLIIFIGTYAYITKEKGCFMERHILLSEELKSSPECKTEECLFITTQPVDSEHNYTRRLVFASDTKTLNEKRGFNIGDQLVFKWCKNKDLEKYFIVGINKVEDYVIVN